MNAPEHAERLAAARMAGHFGMLLTWLRTGVTPGVETLTLCERALNDWRSAADAALAERLDDVIGGDARCGEEIRSGVPNNQSGGIPS